MGKKYFVRKVNKMKKIIQTAGRNALTDFSPEFAHFNDDILFGENWNNQDIDLKTRSIITVVALMSSGITDASLIYHLQNANCSNYHSRCFLCRLAKRLGSFSSGKGGMAARRRRLAI